MVVAITMVAVVAVEEERGEEESRIMMIGTGMMTDTMMTRDIEKMIIDIKLCFRITYIITLFFVYYLHLLSRPLSRLRHRNLPSTRVIYRCMGKQPF